MAILPSVLHGLATYAGFVEGLLIKLFESQMRRYGAALTKPELKSAPKPKQIDRTMATIDRTIATKCPPARKA